jgi:protein TonB
MSCAALAQEKLARGNVDDPEGKAEPLQPDDLMTNPVLLKKIQPDYPELARKAGIQAVVMLKAVLTEEGTVTDVCVARCSAPDLGFEEAAIAAVRQWRYRPGLQNGVPVRVYFEVAIEFHFK